MINVQYPIVSCYIKPILITLNKNKKYVYEVLVKNNDVPTSQEKWNVYFVDDNINWKFVYSYIFKCTKDTYIQWFQTRILHRVLTTIKLLIKMKIVNSEMCTFL